MATRSTMADVAPTLADLKRLPLEHQSSLLLARLIEIYPQTKGAGGLNKHNLIMEGHPHGLGSATVRQKAQRSSDISSERHGLPWLTKDTSWTRQAGASKD